MPRETTGPGFVTFPRRGTSIAGAPGADVPRRSTDFDPWLAPGPWRWRKFRRIRMPRRSSETPRIRGCLLLINFRSRSDMEANTRFERQAQELIGLLWPIQEVSAWVWVYKFIAQLCVRGCIVVGCVCVVVPSFRYACFAYLAVYVSSPCFPLT